MDITDLTPLEQTSLKRGIPILGSAKGQWLLQFIKEHNPQQILELGTANGYSGCILGSEGGELTTIEINPVMAKEAAGNFQKNHIHSQIIVDDAVRIVQELTRLKKYLRHFDLIFIDFAKKKYLSVLEPSLQLLKQGGYIIADNITMEGCQDYKQAVLIHPQLQTELINIKDGLSCSKLISRTK